MNRLLDFSPYLLVGATLALTVVELVKEWDNYKKTWLRTGALIVLCAIAILTFISVHRDRQDQQNQAKAQQKLEGQVEAANTAQTNNTALYLKSFKDLSGQVADLQTQVKTDALQKKLASVQAELEKNEKAMQPGPKAALSFTFWPYTNPPLGSNLPTVLSTDVTLPTDADGNVHVDFTVVNLTDVAAVGGSITLVICDLCKFAKEPSGFVSVPGTKETVRNRPFSQFNAHEVDQMLSVDLIVPSSISGFSLGIQYRCTTCDVANAASQGTVRLRRDFVKPF